MATKLNTLFLRLSTVCIAGMLFTACIKEEILEEELGEQTYIISSSPQGGGEQVVNLPFSVESGQTTIAEGYEGYNFFSPQKIDNAIYCHSETGYYQKYTLGMTGLNLTEMPVINGGEVIRLMDDGRANYYKGIPGERSGRF